MPDGKMNDVAFWVRTVDENGNEHFEKVHKLDEATVDTLSEDDVRIIAAEKVLENRYLMGMIDAYREILGVEIEDEDE